ncbi:SprT family zinc-dependent metalloprotease [Hydrogenophaga sp. PAMC20947]|uniref:M48 family metallopeptidase n=1 Tax=Hydrogenophaga sp. PAMC20947 TaxID=2565558 RepID=UPI00109DB790|nr:SprT family zinc-dependent metalloprotease [Hydrogenophaga sp. PAMC20947]QCB47074.1 M48 family peptidase [Hydrogenophaga sp. PAMC20947]
MKQLLQIAFDFLGGPDAAVPERLPLPASAPDPRAEPRDLHAPPALPLSDVFQPATWHHPRANRKVRLGDSEVAYEFKRGKRRTIGLSVGADGLTVSAPRWTPLGEVDALLRDKSGWVLEKLHKAQQRASDLAQARTVWADGVEFDYLGQRVRLQLDPAHRFAEVGAELKAPAEAGDLAVLYLGLAGNASEVQVRDAAQAWLMRQAKRVFAERLDHFAPQLGVEYGRLRLSSAGTRWGSASVDGTIRLNWRLIHLKLDMLDYVVVHELSHLHHMDHSPQFWDVVARVMPDHVQRRRALKEAAVPLGK